MTPQLSPTRVLLLFFSCTWPLELVFEQFKQNTLKHLGEKKKKKKKERRKVVWSHTACPNIQELFAVGSLLASIFPFSPDFFSCRNFCFFFISISNKEDHLPSSNTQCISASDVFFFYHWKCKDCTSALWKWMWKCVIHSWSNKISHICTKLNGFS